MDRIIRVTIEMEFQPSNVDREDDFCLNKSWKLSSSLWNIIGGRLRRIFEMGSPLSHAGPDRLPIPGDLV
jgi:hypothetical protein